MNITKVKSVIIVKGGSEKFRKTLNPKPWKNEMFIVHGLLRCKTCKCLWDRYMNSSLNIRKITECIINGRERPNYLRRKELKQLILGIIVSVPNLKF